MAIKTGTLKNKNGDILHCESVATKIKVGTSSDVATELIKKLEVSNIKNGNGISISVSGNDITITSINSTVPTGVIDIFAGSVAPSGYLLCNGLDVSRTTYSSLFAVIGTTYGAGNGTTTFNLPNLMGKVVVGLDSTQTEFNSLGKSGGAKTHTLAVNEMPQHTHGGGNHQHIIDLIRINSSFGATWHPATSNWGSAASDWTRGYTGPRNSNNATDGNSADGSHTHDNTGGGLAHNNLQPYMVFNYIIKY